MRFGLFIVFSILLVFLPHTCFAQEREENKQIDVTCHNGGNGLRSYTDAKGDAKLSFIDITEVTVTILQDSIHVRMELAEIPERLPYGGVERLGEEALQYAWEISFDTNCDEKSLGNLVVALYYFTSDTEGEAPLQDFAQSNLWEVGSMGQSIMVQTVGFEVGETSIAWKMPKSAHVALSLIQKNTPVEIRSMSDGEQTVIDTL